VQLIERRTSDLSPEIPIIIVIRERVIKLSSSGLASYLIRRSTDVDT
jgi:hypothetical protein